MSTHTLTDEELFCLEGCRTQEQYDRMRKNFEQCDCTFCNLDREFNHVLHEDPYLYAWEVPESIRRKQGLLVQVIIAPKRHVRAPWELSPDENEALFNAMKRVNATFDLSGGMISARFGDMRLNAGTVPHLHYNFWVPDGTKEVRVPIFKDPADRAENQKRAAEFAARYEASEQP